MYKTEFFFYIFIYFGDSFLSFFFSNSGTANTTIAWYDKGKFFIVRTTIREKKEQNQSPKCIDV
jgi:hypothetical protein